MKPIAQVYHTLAVAYATSEELRNCINKYSETFERDNNMGLVKQVRMFFILKLPHLKTFFAFSKVSTSLYKKNIQRLTKTFLTLSLSDVASRVQLPSAAVAEKYILNMVNFLFFYFMTQTRLHNLKLFR